MPPRQEPTPAALAASAEAFARKAGALLAHRVHTGFSVEHKGVVDLVTEVDRASQDLLEQEIRRAWPGHGILAEEGLDRPGDTGLVWVVDPIDGTTNFVHGFPVFAVSIGVYREGKALAGAVYNPMADEMYTASAGGGAFLNRRPLGVSRVSSVEQALLGTGFPYAIREMAQNNLSHFAAMAVAAQGIRRCGSASLDLCWVAAGRLDGFWELSLKPWDIAAGALVVREAGGRVTDFMGDDLSLDGSRTLASNGLLHAELSRILLASA